MGRWVAGDPAVRPLSDAPYLRGRQNALGLDADLLAGTTKNPSRQGLPWRLTRDSLYSDCCSPIANYREL
jgi:hypothetical protein